jgi:hypothetical protein
MANTRRGKKRWSLYRIRRAAPKKSRKKEQHIRKTPLGRGLFNISDGIRQPPPIPLSPNLSTRARFASMRNSLETMRTLPRNAVVFGQRVSPRTAQDWQTAQAEQTALTPRRLLKAAKERPPIIGVNPLENERMKDKIIATIEKAAKQISRAPNYGQRYFDIKQGALALGMHYKKITQPNSLNPFNNDNIDIESLNAWNEANLGLGREHYDLPSLYITHNIMTLYVSRIPNILKNIDDQLMSYRNYKIKISNHLKYVIDLVIEQKIAAIQENFFTTGPHFEPAGPRVLTFVNEKRSKFPLQPPMVDKFAAIGTLINPQDIAPAIPISEVSTERMTSFLPAVFIKILETKVEEKIREAEAKLEKTK